MKIVGNRIKLRPIKESDIEKLRAWRNQYRESFFDSKAISPEQQQRWWDKYKLNPPGTTIMLIANLFSGEEIGTISLDHINVDDRSAELGHVLLLDEYRHKGYSQEMVNTLSDFAFKTMRLHRLFVETDIANDDAISIYHKAGYKMVGLKFLQTEKFTYRIVAKLEKINPNHDIKHPVTLFVLDEDEE